MQPASIQEQCELGQRQLMEMRYLEAERTLAAAEQLAWDARDWDTLSRLYLPLQETRRQRRQRCGEGIVRLDLLAKSPESQPDSSSLAEEFPHGQLLVGGWGSIAPAKRLRILQTERELYAETFLAAVYPAGSGRVVVIVPSEEVALPAADVISGIDALIPRLPAHCIVLSSGELPAGNRVGSPRTFGEVMAIWERLHAPFLAAADMLADPIQRMDAYRRTIRVDYACESAHQRLADVAREMMRTTRSA